MQNRVVFAAFATALVLAGCAGHAVVEAESDAGSPGSGGGGGAPLVDAGPPDSDTSDAGTTDAGPELLCPMDGVPTAAVAGTTPLGDIDLQYGWLGYFGGECGGIRIGLSAVPSLEPVYWTDPSPPSLMFGPSWDPVTGYLGAKDADFTVNINGQEASAKGWLEISRADPQPNGPVGEGMEYPRAEGTITINASGWNVSGSFTALYCNWMDILCP